LTKYSNLSKKELQAIAKQEKKFHNTHYREFDKHYKFIRDYCIKNELRSLSFKRGTPGKPNSTSICCELFSPLEFLTRAQRRDVVKQLEEIS